ncbi:diguanylate cyclase (GGDEF)-like protein/PAS domain S-box-containing protein [Azospirillum fermentarium]|uniref:sensor domain-containing diguanylate cyclase n=1 Tax=Azospirillum fermentarium TaxID=1233114 RepID=UPI0022260CDD|nr:diguanylate cyclase [Azospirillum fermentarium]MCW2245992.1 diguanylate cyclase (GGDEF)-like protein/PAS domain S-box-containing protein [Azospirillum fermentarium]
MPSSLLPAETAVPLDEGTLCAIVGSFPGAAMRLDAGGGIVAANPAAEELSGSDGAWLADVRHWLTSASVAPGVRAVPVEAARGAMVIEWSAVPLADGGALLLARDATLERQLRHTLTESRQRYKDLVEASSDFAWETGGDGRFVFVTPKGALGYGADALIGRHPRELCVEEWGDLPLPFDTQRPVDQSELWLKGADGSMSCVVASAVPLYSPSGRWLGARGVCRDITEQVMRSAELARVRNRERLLSHIVHTLRNQLDAGEALRVATAETARALGADGCRVYRGGGCGDGVAALEVMEDFCAATPPELAGAALMPLLEQAAVSDEPAAGAIGAYRLLACVTEHQQALNGALVVWRADDAEPWDDDDRHLIAGVADHIGIAHAHLAYQDRLRRLSERDGLTGLFNRRTFFERMGEQLERPDTGPSALLYVDLDNFKAVNDLHGHQQGDAVLKAIGTLLTGGVRPGDLPGRLGGDEFVLWVGRTDEDSARVVAERLLNGIAGLRHLSASPEKPLGLSIGIAVYHPGLGETVQELTDRADTAMYAAKGRGKGNYAFAGPYQPPSSPVPTDEAAESTP